jgi:hypothetical protein
VDRRLLVRSRLRLRLGRMLKSASGPACHSQHNEEPRSGRVVVLRFPKALSDWRECAHPVARPAPLSRGSPRLNRTPLQQLAERTRTPKSDLEGERRLVTVPFAGLKGSMELLVDRDPQGSPQDRRSGARTHDGDGR